MPIAAAEDDEGDGQEASLPADDEKYMEEVPPPPPPHEAADRETRHAQMMSGKSLLNEVRASRKVILLAGAG